MELNKSLTVLCGNMETISMHSNMEETDSCTARQISECKEVICNASQNDRARPTEMDRNKTLRIFQNCVNAIELPQCEATSLPTFVKDFAQMDDVLLNLLPVGLSVMLYLIQSHCSPGRVLCVTIVLAVTGMLTTRFECTGDYQLMRRLHAENLEILASLSDGLHASHPVLEVEQDKRFGDWLLGRCYQLLLSFFSSLYVRHDKI